MGMLVLVLVL